MTARAYAGILAALIVLSACQTEGQVGERATFQSPRAQSTSANKASGMLDFQAPKLGGGTVNGSDFAGQDVAMWFWAPW